MKVKRIREAWGVWEKRNDHLHLHPLNLCRPGFIHDAYVNLVISVQVSTEDTEWGNVTHLWIKHRDGRPMIWRDMQRIKNELVGYDRVAVEVYPSTADLVDVADMYHLWVLPAGFRLPFSLKQRRTNESS